MSLAANIAAAVGLTPDAAEDKVSSAFTSAAVDLFTATGAKTLQDAAEVAKKNSAELEQLRIAHEAQKTAAEASAAKLAQIEADKKKAELDALIKAAGEDGRLPPSKRDAFAANAEKHGIEWAKATLDMLPVLASGAPPPKAPEVSEAKLDAALMAELKQLGVTEDEVRAAKARGHV